MREGMTAPEDDEGLAIAEVLMDIMVTVTELAKAITSVQGALVALVSDDRKESIERLKASLQDIQDYTLKFAESSNSMRKLLEHHRDKSK